jgi:hypothetical protein
MLKYCGCVTDLLYPSGEIYTLMARMLEDQFRVLSKLHTNRVGHIFRVGILHEFYYEIIQFHFAQ